MANVMEGLDSVDDADSTANKTQRRCEKMCLKD